MLRSSTSGGVPLELPRREAPHVDVVLVESGVVTVARELDLELHLRATHREVTDRTERANARASPRAVGAPPRELTVFNGRALSTPRLLPLRCHSWGVIRGLCAVF